MILRFATYLLYAFPLLLAGTRGGVDAAISVIGALFLIESLRGKRWRWLREADMRVLLALWIFMIATAPLSPVDPMASFKLSLIWGRFVLFYAALRYWLWNAQTLKVAAKITLGVVSLIMVDAMWQYQTGTSLTGHPLFGGTRLTGPLSHANLGNMILKLGLPATGIMLYTLIEERAKPWLFSALGIFALALIALVLVSGERSTTLLMLMGVGIIGLVLFICHKQARKWVTMGGAAFAAFIAVVAATQPIVQQRALWFVTQMSTFWDSYYGQLYQSGWYLFKSSPLHGIGVQQFMKACPELMAKYGITYCDVHPHNMYLEWLAATGVIGFALFVTAMTVIVCRLIKSVRFKNTDVVLAAFACGTMAIVLFPLIVTQSQFANWPGILFWYSVATAASLPRAGKGDA